MTTITVPIDRELEDFINSELASGRSETKAHVVRYALRKLREERAIAELLEAEKEIREGKVLRGDLREIMKKIK
jgi:Arc/MetJ-type ribon-helix-helix transcriptional regulator